MALSFPRSLNVRLCATQSHNTTCRRNWKTTGNGEPDKPNEKRRRHSLAGATGDGSSCWPLAALLSSVGEALSPKVFCVIEAADQGAGPADLATQCVELFLMRFEPAFRAAPIQGCRWGSAWAFDRQWYTASSAHSWNGMSGKSVVIHISKVYFRSKLTICELTTPTGPVPVSRACRRPSSFRPWASGRRGSAHDSGVLGRSSFVVSS